MASLVFGTISAPVGTLNKATQNGTANTFAMYTGAGGLTASNIASGASVAGSNTGDVTLGTASGLSLTGQVLSLQLASASLTGALSSTDWATFNGKQATLAFAQSLVNTANTVTLVNDSATPGNSMYYGTNGSGTKGYYAMSGSSTVYFPALTVLGSGASITGPTVLSLGSQPAYFPADKAITIYKMVFSVASIGAATQNVTFQPYGNTAAGAGGFIGTAKTVSVPGAGNDVTYTQTQSISLTSGGYVGMAVSPASGGGAYRISVVLWGSMTGP